MSLRINLKQGEILELTNIVTDEIVKFRCQEGTYMSCENCALMLHTDICDIVNCNGNYREDKAFVHFVKVK